MTIQHNGLVSPGQTAALATLRNLLQNELTTRDFEELAAALLSRFLGISIALAKTGFQFGADGGTSGRQSRRLRMEAKRYSDTTSLSDRELLGEVDNAIAIDPALEAWILVASRPVSEQLELQLLKKSDETGVPIVIIDWKIDEIPLLAALCTFARDLIKTYLSEDAAKLVDEIRPVAASRLQELKRDLEGWNLGYERLRTLTLARLNDIWTNPRTAVDVMGQDAAGGHVTTTIRRENSFAELQSWWDVTAATDAPAILKGFGGYGKTWAVLDWLQASQALLPITLIVSPTMVAGLGPISEVGLHAFIAARLYEITKSRDLSHWERRVSRLFKRPLHEGPVLTVLFDGLNEQPNAPWLEIFRTLQNTSHAGLVRILATTRPLELDERLGGLRGLVVRPTIVDIGLYDDSAGSEFEQRLALEGLTPSDLHKDLIPYARIPRLFTLVTRFKDRFVAAGQVTVHRLLWEYGRDTLGTRASSFSEDSWRSWLQEVAQHHLEGINRYNLKTLGETAQRPDLTQNDIFRRLSEIVDSNFAAKLPGGGLALSADIVNQALGAALLRALDDEAPADRAATDTFLVTWLDPIGGFDERAEILRAAISILVDREYPTPPHVTVSLVSEWLQSQNIPEDHHAELLGLGSALFDPLMEIIESNRTSAGKIARHWILDALKASAKRFPDTFAKIVGRLTDWLQIISRDVQPSGIGAADFEKARVKRYTDRLGFDADGVFPVLGNPLTFVANQSSRDVSDISALLENAALQTATPFFRAAAVQFAIRGRGQLWDGIKWICLLNEIDFDLTSAAISAEASNLKILVPEPGIHPELPLRTAALMLWLSGNEENEVLANEMDVSLDRQFSYEKDYLEKPGLSIFKLERAHAHSVLLDRSLHLDYRIDRCKHFWFDPTFIPPAEFVTELREYCKNFNVKELDIGRSTTSQDFLFERLSPGLARCAPDILTEIMRRKTLDFEYRTPEAKSLLAANLGEQFLILDGPCLALLDKAKGSDELADERSYALTQLLIPSIFPLSAVGQVEAILSADFEEIYYDLTDTLKDINSDDVDRLIADHGEDAYASQRKLIVIFAVKASGLSDVAWEWVLQRALDSNFKANTEALRLLVKCDPSRLGRELVSRGWVWNVDSDVSANHYCSVALINGSEGLPFEQIVSSIAPWLIPYAVFTRGGAAPEARMAAQVLDAIVAAPNQESPDPGSDIYVDSDTRAEYPESFSLLPHYDDISEIEKLKLQMDSERRAAIRQRALDTALERIREARKNGASLYLHNMAPRELIPIIKAAPKVVKKWLEGMKTASRDFRRRVLLAEGFYIALCEALLTEIPDLGVPLWDALHFALNTNYVGRGELNELILMLFRAPPTPQIEELRSRQVGLEYTSTDQGLFEVCLAAALAGQSEWIDNFAKKEKISDATWKRQRGLILEQFSSGNRLPVIEDWPSGPTNLKQSRQQTKENWQHKEACARHWWEAFWNLSDDIQAFAAWTLLIEGADRRTYVWGDPHSPVFTQHPWFDRRLAHYHLNMRRLRGGFKKREKSLDGEFLGRRTVKGVGPWSSET